MDNPVIFGNIRCSVINAICVRIEYSPTGSFCDDPTLFAQKRKMNFTDFTVNIENTKLTLQTAEWELTYHAQKGPAATRYSLY